MTARRWCLLLVLLPPLALSLAGGALPSAEPDKNVRQFEGKVVPLSAALEKDGVKLDPDAAGLALVAADGTVLPLVKDPGSRMFFKDRALQGRPMRLAGRLVAGGKLLQVLSVRSLVDGKPHEPHYWCDICKIKRFEPNDCDCCGAPLEFREEPVAR